MNAMAVTIFDPLADPEVFDEWVCDVRSAAEVTQGFVAFSASVRRDAPLDWAVAVTFESEELLHHWLDGSTWKQSVRSGAARGFLRLCSDLVIIEGAVMPTGVAIVSSSVSGGMEADFQAAHVRLTKAASQFSGYEGTAVFPPGALGKWMSLIVFRTEAQLGHGYGRRSARKSCRRCGRISRRISRYSPRRPHSARPSGTWTGRRR